MQSATLLTPGFSVCCISISNNPRILFCISCFLSFWYRYHCTQKRVPQSWRKILTHLSVALETYCYSILREERRFCAAQIAPNLYTQQPWQQLVLLPVEDNLISKTENYDVVKYASHAGSKGTRSLIMWRSTMLQMKQSTSWKLIPRIKRHCDVILWLCIWQNFV